MQDKEDLFTILISPTEPPRLREIGTVSSTCEKKGCDVIIVTPEVRIGIQRKTWIDLVISLDDGRLAGSIPKMDMGIKIAVIEGPRPSFDRTRHMIVRSNSKKAKHGFVTLRHTPESLLGVCFSLRYNSGIDVIRSESLTETIMIVQRLARYISKSKHHGITGRRTGGAGTLTWGADLEERQHAQKINFLMGAGIGAKTAENLIKANGGRIPLQWTMTDTELLSVPLIGASAVTRMRKLLG